MSTTPHTPPARRFGAGALLLALLVGAGLAGTAAWWQLRPHDDTHAGEATRYTCPMHADVVQDHPGDCPLCGMPLVPLEAPVPGPGAAAAAHAAHAPVAGQAAITIDPARQQLIGLATAEVTRGAVGGTWRTVGRVSIDETRVRHVNLKFAGYVERIYVDFIGKKVRKGDPLFAIYSPELLAAQEEYLLALRTRGALTAGGGSAVDGDSLVKGARRKLALWDITQAELDRVAATGEPMRSLTVHSPVAGVVTKKDVVEGMKLDAGAMPYEIIDLSSVWVLADIYETELRYIEEGMPASLVLNAFPERTFTGKVLFIDPLLDPRTRTVKVRLAFPNPAGDLRPEMFGEVVLSGAPREGLRVPRDAVVDSGLEKLVFVALGDGKFEPRTVRLGAVRDDAIEVIGGVTAGERVVTRANFLIDAESKLRSSLAEMADTRPAGGDPTSARVLPGTTPPAPTPTPGPAGAPPPPPHVHGGGAP